MDFKKAILEKEFVVTAEIFPPKGTDLTVFLAKAELLKPLVDGINVTDNQRAVMRISSMAASRLLLERGCDPVYQLTCRDRNRLALQSDLIGAWTLGIKNVLALSGDYPTNGDHPEAKPVYDLDTIQLIRAIAILNNGTDLSGHALEGKPDFLTGAVCNPVYDDMDLQYMMIMKKISAGALFFQTQAIFDPEVFRTFLKTVDQPKTRFLAGILPLKSARMARMLNEKVPGVSVPEEIIRELERSSDPLRKGLEIAASLIRELRAFSHGIHIMAINFEEKIPDLLKLSE